MARIAVIGATGDVGFGIVSAAGARRWSTVAVARQAGRLHRLAAEFADPTLVLPVVGSLADEASAGRLAAELTDLDVAAVVVAVNTAIPERSLTEWQADELSSSVLANLAPHHLAARRLLPALPADGVLIGIGGGTADFVWPGRAPLSLVQAAQRMLYRGLAEERATDTASVKEIIVASMVNGRSSRASAKPDWLTDREVGDYVCEVVASPGAFADDILTLTPPAVRP